VPGQAEFCCCDDFAQGNQSGVCRNETACTASGGECLSDGTTTTTGEPTTTTTSEPTTTTTAAPSDLPIFKVDGENNRLGGACFTLYEGACGPTGDPLTDGCVNDATPENIANGSAGRVIFENLAAGTYCVVESTIPEGYSGDGPRTANLPDNASGLSFINTLLPTTTTPACLPDYSSCTYDEDCCTGCCGQNATVGEPPNQYCLPAEYCECRVFGEECGLIINGTYPAGEAHQLDCCEDLLCLHGYPGEVNADDRAMYCAECRRDHHCDKDEKCCFGRCIPEWKCCTDHDCDDCEECADGHCRLTGVPFGETCGYVINGTAISWESDQLDCCDGLVCCDVDKDGKRCFECCGDWDCPKGSDCKHGVCEFECKHDKDCPDDTCCCKSGHCSKHCCHHHKPDKPDYTPGDKPGYPSGGTVDTLPATGAGDDESGLGWIGAAALGAAAAYVAGKTIRSETPKPEGADD
jgi:LPXTG-motif cell wall-anchored protein